MTGIVVTGMGALSCYGSGVDTFWAGLTRRERVTPRPVEQLGPELTPLTTCLSVPAGALPAEPDPDRARAEGRTTRAARAVVREALAEAGLDAAADGGGRRAVLIASGVGEAALVEDWRAGTVAPPAGWTPTYATAAALAEEFGAEVAATGLSNACAGGSYALAMGADLIRAGEADVVIAGGVEMYARVTMAGFNRLGAIDPDGCRPFHRDRRGTGMGEGAAAVVLESEEHARRRGAAPLGRLLASGWSCDAYHATAPDPEAVEITRAMRETLRQAGRGADEVSFVVPHATGTQLSDTTECRALHQVFGARAAEIPLYSLKALLGHTGGASGALAAVAAVLMLRHGRLPGNLPVADLDPECEVWLPTEPVTDPGGLAMTNAFGFGGHNISLLFERYGRRAD
ncbi:beta-ketoacyl-[acyl-carrier-protein] synthase family protein [Streptomyces pactum]|uniref:beta-ketoacyl-[acyl-carrier-protein] synthase family protein n=1 Tax=Streptomyces pactum TaxID=68249 RepID=UPI0037021FA4